MTIYFLWLSRNTNTVSTDSITAFQVAMNLDELVCGALESSFWAMDRKESERFILGRHSSMLLIKATLICLLSSVDLYQMNSTPFIIRCRQKSQAEQCQGFNSLKYEMT